MDTEQIRFKREILGVLGLLLLGSLMVVYQFLDAIILAGATSYFLRYGHKVLNKKLDNEFLSSLIIISTIIGIIFLSLFFFVQNFSQISNSAGTLAESYQNGTQKFIEASDISETAKQSLKDQSSSVFEPERVKDVLTDILVSLPSVFIDIGIYLVVAIYLYKDGTKIKKTFYSTVERLPDNEEKIVRTLVRSIDSIFRGVFLTQFTVAAILGVISAAGFLTIGYLTTPIPFVAFWSVLIGIAALMPLFAAFMIYGPIGLYYLFSAEPVKGGLILGFGTLVLNVLPEILIRPYIGSRQMNEHPLIIFLGFIAGPLTLGLKGIVLGPVLLILAKDFIMNYSELVSSENVENHTGNENP